MLRERKLTSKLEFHLTKLLSTCGGGMSNEEINVWFV